MFLVTSAAVQFRKSTSTSSGGSHIKKKKEGSLKLVHEGAEDHSYRSSRQNTPGLTRLVEQMVMAQQEEQLQIMSASRITGSLHFLTRIRPPGDDFSCLIILTRACTNASVTLTLKTGFDCVTEKEMTA